MKRFLLCISLLLLLTSSCKKEDGSTNPSQTPPDTTGTVVCNTDEIGTWTVNGNSKATSYATFTKVPPGSYTAGFVFSYSGRGFASPSFSVVAGKTTSVSMSFPFGGMSGDWSITGPY
jgi:hypothetical protein